MVSSNSKQSPRRWATLLQPRPTEPAPPWVSKEVGHWTPTHHETALASGLHPEIEDLARRVDRWWRPADFVATLEKETR
jgi:hypothetical protein